MWGRQCLERVVKRPLQCLGQPAKDRCWGTDSQNYVYCLQMIVGREEGMMQCL